jgi:MSHA biogenesis protein MshQ
VFDCAPSMNCPAVSADASKPSYPLAGAMYSAQSFKFNVSAFGLPKPDANGAPQPQLLSLFRNLAGSAANGNVVGTTTYRNVTLSKAARPTDATGATSALKGSFALVPANAFPASSGLADVKEMKATGSYTLSGAVFDPAKRSVQPSAPEMFYLRASMKEKMVTGEDIEVSSATPAATPAIQYEAGLMVVSGRLLVPNVFGSEMLRVPLALTAQYWNGSAWLTSAKDSTSTVASTLAPFKCTGSFAASCNAGALTLASGATGVRVDGGTGKLILQSPGRGKLGSVDFTLGSSAAPWLPSTRARVTFGLPKSPLIYLREVY